MVECKDEIPTVFLAAVGQFEGSVFECLGGSEQTKISIFVVNARVDDGYWLKIHF